MLVSVPLTTPPPPHQWRRAGALKLKSFKIIYGRMRVVKKQSPSSPYTIGKLPSYWLI